MCISKKKIRKRKLMDDLMTLEKNDELSALVSFHRITLKFNDMNRAGKFKPVKPTPPFLPHARRIPGLGNVCIVTSEHIVRYLLHPTSFSISHFLSWSIVKTLASLTRHHIHVCTRATFSVTFG